MGIKVDKKKIRVGVVGFFIIIFCFLGFEMIYYSMNPPNHLHLRFPVMSVANNKPIENATVWVVYGKKDSWNKIKLGKTNDEGIIENNVPVVEGKDIWFLFWDPKRKIDGATKLPYQDIHPPWWKIGKWFDSEAPEEVKKITKVIRFK